MLRLGPVARMARADGRHRPAPVDPVVRPDDAAQVGPRERETPDVWIWADSFSDHFFPGNGHAAIRYLESVGLTARVIPDDACCGLTWITTGQLDKARVIMERTVAALRRTSRAASRSSRSSRPAWPRCAATPPS